VQPADNITIKASLGCARFDSAIRILVLRVEPRLSERATWGAGAPLRPCG
jgi:hypothetical protein